MNLFFVIDDTIVTPAIADTILPGVTRDSATYLAARNGDACRRASRVQECFGTGAAATLSHIRRIRYRDRDLHLPLVERRVIGTALRDRLVAIATGQMADTHNWLEVI